MTGLNLTYSRYSDPQINYTLKTLTSENSTEKACRDYRYVFQFKDHLGNVRMSYADLNKDGKVDKSEILSEDSYYPMGGRHRGYNNVVSSQANSVAERHKYNGKELEEDLGLNLYDYQFRRFDPVIGRFTTIDPLANEPSLVAWSPYHYTYNNPLIYTDPDGRFPLLVGALIGAAADYTVQVVGNFAEGKSGLDAFTDVDGKSIAISAAAGATGVGLVSKLGKMGKLARTAIEAGTDAAASAGTQLAKDGKINARNVGADVLLGQTAGKVAGNVAEKQFLKSAKGRKLQNAVNQQKNAAKGKSNTISKKNANVKGAKNKLNQAAAVRAVGAGTAASGTGGIIVDKVLKKEEKKDK